MCEAAVPAAERGGGHGFAGWMSTLTGPAGTQTNSNLLHSHNNIHPPVEDGKQAGKVHARYKMMVL